MYKRQGHTNIVLVEDYGVYKIIGRTRDDAAGEAFDKVARAAVSYTHLSQISSMRMSQEDMWYLLHRESVLRRMSRLLTCSMTAMVLPQKDVYKRQS